LRCGTVAGRTPQESTGGAAMTLRIQPLRVALLSIALAAPAMATMIPAPDVTPPGNQPTPPPAQNPITATAHTQTEGLAYLIEIDQQQLALARQARTKVSDQKIRDLANKILTDLSQNLDITRLLAVDAKAKLVDTTEITASRAADKTALDALGKIDKATYGAEYLKTLVADYTANLDLIDKRLLTEATDERIKDHLQATRTLMAAHLGRAQEMQSSGK
jgi:hypothetical protein